MRMLFLLAALGGALTACSVSFDPAGQPCDIRGQCLPGYRCDATKHCVTGPGGTSGSGTSGGSGSSTTGASGTTGSGACANVVCPIEESCVPRDGGADCQRAVFACATDAECTFGSSCLRNGTTLGFCSATCVADGGASSCGRGFACIGGLVGTRGNSASRCLPLPAPRNCTRPADCAGGFSCLPFDDTQVQFNADPSLPIGFCDAPIDGGAAAGVSCTTTRRCASGLCAATASTGVGVCLDGCAQDTDCPSGHACTEVRSVESARLTRACTASVTTCQACTASCGPDAPDCDSRTGRCVLFCRAGDDSACGPSTRTCRAFSGGSSPFCSADGGAGC
jgi:hypothetical protein